MNSQHERLVAFWERKLKRFPELIPVDELERSLGYRHVRGEDPSGFYRAAGAQVAPFARKERLSRQGRKILKLYLEGRSVRGTALAGGRGRTSVKLLVRRFEAFCRSMGLTPRARYASRKVACRKPQDSRSK